MAEEAKRFHLSSSSSALPSVRTSFQTRYFDSLLRLPCVFGRAQQQSEWQRVSMRWGRVSRCSQCASRCWSLKLALTWWDPATVVSREVVGWEAHLLAKKNLGLEEERWTDLPFQSPSRHLLRSSGGHHLFGFLTLCRMKKRLAQWVLWTILETRWKVIASLALTAWTRQRLVCSP